MHELIVEPGKGERLYWRDVWRYRELLLFLAWRDLLVRYKQTVAGVLWAVLRPVLGVVAFTVVFHKLAGLKSNQVPYQLLVFAAMLPWQLFSSTFLGAGSSVTANAHIVSKVYFPRILIPLGAVANSLSDFLLSLLLLGVLLVQHGTRPGWQIAAFPVFTLLTIALAMGPGLLFAAVNVRFRDAGVIAPFALQFGMFVSPVGFSSQIVPAEWRLLFSLNPMVGVIDGFRWCLWGDAAGLYWPGVAISIAFALLFLLLGVWYFRRTELYFADII